MQRTVPTTSSAAAAKNPNHYQQHSHHQRSLSFCHYGEFFRSQSNSGNCTPVKRRLVMDNSSSKPVSADAETGEPSELCPLKSDFDDTENFEVTTGTTRTNHYRRNDPT